MACGLCPVKTESMNIGRSRPTQQPVPDLTFDNLVVNNVTTHTHLGLKFAADLSWTNHIDEKCKIASKRLDVLKGLSWKLDRKSIETLYKAHVRPILEYGDVIYAECSEQDSLKLEKLNLKALRIITGCTISTTRANLYTESKIQPLELRRKNHKLLLFYKIVNNLTSETMEELLPSTNVNRVNYQLRNVTGFPVQQTRTNAFRNSFINSTVRLWNDLELETRESVTLQTFKNKLNRTPPVPRQFYLGCRFASIHHCRIRNKCSALNHHLFINHVLDSPLCSCNVEAEDAIHYFFKCRKYIRQRNVMELELSNFNINVETLLHGNGNLKYDENKVIFSSVHKYIINTKRFKRYR